VPSEKADYQRPLAEEIGRVYLHVILIEQGEGRSKVANLQCSPFNPRSLELGRGAMHGFDHFERRIVYGGVPDSNDFLNSSRRS
jgi:hypothetical protein